MAKKQSAKKSSKKPAKKAAKKAVNKTAPTKRSAKDLIAAVAGEQKRKDSETLLKLMRKVTGKSPVVWGNIVGFGKYHYKYESGREGDMFLTGFAPRAQNLVVYVMPGFSGADDLLKRLGKHKIGKSCLYINKLADLDAGVLEELLRRSYEHMCAKYGVKQ